MTYKPQSNSKKEKLISAFTALFAVVLIIVSGAIQRFGGIFQIAAIILGVVSIEFYLKYVGSEYIYVAEDHFKVYKVTGNKSICVSSLDYEMSLSYVVSSKDYEKDKSAYPKFNFNVNLCKNFLPDEYSVYFFEFNGKKCMMKFEPDSIFTDYINSLISAAWKQDEDCED